MPTPTRREQVAHNLTPRQLDAFARRAGFPSAQALNTVIRLGAYIQENGHIQQDGRISGVKRIAREWIDRIAAVYPNIPRSTLLQYADRIHTVNDLARVFGVDPQDAQTYVNNHINNSIETELNRKLDKRTSGYEAPTHLKPLDGSL